MSIDAYLVLVGATLFLCGIAYAWYVTHSPHRPALACWGVALGCGFTNVGISLAIWLIIGDWRPIGLVWAGYILTGSPMLAFKIWQEEKRKEEAMEYAGLLMGKRAVMRWPDAD